VRAGLIIGKERFELAEVPEPVPGERQVVVDVQRCGICGSDVHAYVEGWRYAPGVCGHEWVGLVSATGPGVVAVGEGDRVAAGMAPGCGGCADCRAGRPEYCAVARSSYAGRRAPTNGGFARAIAIDANRLCRLPDGVDDVQGAGVEPASVAWHGVQRSRIRPGDVTCVVGCGAIGLLTLQCVRIAGAGYVVVVEPDAARRERALDLGADAALAPGSELREHLDSVTGGLRADIAIDCAGVPASLQQSVDMVRRGGSVCLLGVTGGDVTVAPMRWIGKEVSVDASMLFTLDEMATVVALVAEGTLRVTELHDATVDLDQLGQTIDDLATRRLTAVKVLVDPTAG
jgi:(R,R)-butanediol dehydrogenase / meso-butanediol dehydrogenase / diacetyl reductase